MSTPTTAPPAAPAAPEGLTITRALVLRLVLKHAFWVVILSAIGPTIAYFYAKRQIPAYESATTVIFDFSQPRALGRNVDTYDPYSDYYNREALIATELKVMGSMRVAKQVVADAGLDHDQTFLLSVYGNPVPAKVSVDELAMVIRDRIRPEVVRGTQIVSITYTDSDGPRTQRLVSVIADAYIRISMEDAAGTTGATLEWLSGEVNRLRQELETSEMSLHDYKLKRNLLSVSLNDQNNMLREEMNALNNAVIQAVIKRAALVSRANALAKVTRATPDDLPAAEFLSDSVLQSLRSNFLGARGELGSLTAAGKLPSHPDVRIAQSRLDAALDAFVHQVRNLQLAALREANVFSAEASNLQGLLENAKKRALDLNVQEIEYNRMHRATVSSEKLYGNVLERLKEVDVGRMVSAKNIKVLDPPLPVGAPIRPRIPTMVAMGAALGVLAGILMAVIRELADRTLKLPSDLEIKLGITPLGVLPSVGDLKTQGPKRRKRGLVIAEGAAPELVTHEHPNSNMAEAMRSVRSNVTFMTPDRPARLLLVTSAGPGEGKTTVASSLATTFAQTGARVLLIDLDLRKPRLHRVFGTGSERGITTTLLGEPIEDAVFETQIPNLSLMPAGPLPPNPAELLMSEKLKNLLAELGKRYDRVVIDSPPINPVTDAVVLAKLVDGTVMVCRSEQTTLDDMRSARRTLADVKAHVLGAVLNGVDFTRFEYRYSYYYGHYGRYGTYGESNATGS